MLQCWLILCSPTWWVAVIITAKPCHTTIPTAQAQAQAQPCQDIHHWAWGALEWARCTVVCILLHNQATTVATEHHPMVLPQPLAPILTSMVLEPTASALHLLELGLLELIHTELHPLELLSWDKGWRSRRHQGADLPSWGLFSIYSDQSCVLFDFVHNSTNQILNISSSRKAKAIFCSLLCFADSNTDRPPTEVPGFSNAGCLNRSVWYSCFPNLRCYMQFHKKIVATSEKTTEESCHELYDGHFCDVMTSSVLWCREKSYLVLSSTSGPFYWFVWKKRKKWPSKERVGIISLFLLYCVCSQVPRIRQHLCYICVHVLSFLFYLVWGIYVLYVFVFSSCV